MKETFLQPECAPCFVETAMKFIKAGTGDQDKILAGMQKVYELLANEFHPGAYTFIIGNKMARMINEFLADETEDIFKRVKMESNEACQKLFPILESKFGNMTGTRERLSFALKAAVAGNNIDVGTAGHEFDLEREALEDALAEVDREGFVIDDTGAFISLVEDPGCKNFLVMLDNAGEIVFDKLLLRVLRENGKHVTCMVRGQPIANDATLEDALDAGLDKECDGFLETSIASLGYTIDDNDDGVVEKVNTMDVILGKGQANTETLTVYRDEIRAPHVFVLSKIKCDTVARLKGVRKAATSSRK